MDDYTRKHLDHAIEVAHGKRLDARTRAELVRIVSTPLDGDDTPPDPSALAKASTEHLAGYVLGLHAPRESRADALDRATPEYIRGAYLGSIRRWEASERAYAASAAYHAIAREQIARNRIAAEMGFRPGRRTDAREEDVEAEMRRRIAKEGN